MKEDLNNIKQNLKLAKNSYKLSCDILNGQIEEFASLLKNTKYSYEKIAALYSDLFDDPFLSKTYIMTCRCLSDRNLLVSKYSKIDLSVSTVSYVDNTYSRKAIENFRSIITLYADPENDFTAVCEAVYSNRSKYGILPLYNTRDGLIISLYKILKKYDLKVLASTNVIMLDGETETEFFLISRDIITPTVCDRLVLSVTHPYDNTLTELLYAFGSIGASLLSVNTLPLEYTDERCETLIIINLLPCKHEAICCFLSAALPDANILGIYNYVK